MELLQEHGFDLVRQRKHKIYRNPDGLTFVVASTPSDRQAPQNALSTLKRILRQVNPEPEPVQVITPTPLVEPASAIQALHSIVPIAAVEPAPPSVSDQEWEAWKRQYWHDEKLRAKNERFLSVVSRYVDRASELFHKNESIRLGPVTNAVKQVLRDCHYKSKVVPYNCKCFEQGIVVADIPHVPVLWASNGHIGISALLLINAYVQHGTSRVTTLRFDWNDFPVLLELPEKEAREFYVPHSSNLPKAYRGGSNIGCPVCHYTQEIPPLESMAKDQGWKCNRCGTVNKLELLCPDCKIGIIVLTEFFGYCPNCPGTPSR
jgi:predicted RNA binding protein YcfA (HicA-like mRNA interferase family)